MDDVKTSKEEFTGIEWPDYLVIAAYFIFVLIVGLIVSFFFFLLECLHIFTHLYIIILNPNLVIMEKQKRFSWWIFFGFKKYAFYTSKFNILNNLK